jgi:hypothetical protein
LRALSETAGGILLTFDDGGRSAVEIGALLAERGWCAHIFVVSDRVETSGFLRRADIRALHDAGHVMVPTRLSPHANEGAVAGANCAMNGGGAAGRWKT